MRLKRGEKAPLFSVNSYNGEDIELLRFEGSKVLLSFFRGASCPFCNMRVRELISRYDEFQKNNLKVLCFFNATSEEIALNAGNQNPLFPIISDSKGKIYKLYRIELSRKGMFWVMINPLKMIKMMFSGFFNTKSLKDEPIIPADFLINEHGLIHEAHYGKDFGDHIATDKIIKWISST
jgi:peroxiredoxin